MVWWAGFAVAALTVASAIRRKGLVRGVLHTAFDALPVVGPVKTAAEIARGRDFFPDRERTTRPVRSTRNHVPQHG